MGSATAGWPSGGEVNSARLHQQTRRTQRQARRRMSEALRTTKMSPAEVSFLLGFEDPNSLWRAFQRWTGTTPESWRAQVMGVG